MIKVYVKKQSNYPVTSSKLKERVKKLLKEKGIVSDSILTIAIVGKKKMRELAKTYLEEEKGEHTVLSFPYVEGKDEFVYPDDKLIRLGEIVICFPLAFEEAKKEGKRIDEKVGELAEHGALHLIGIHH